MLINNIIDQVKLPFRKDKELYLRLKEMLGVLPHDISYYKQALMHKSVMRRNAKGRPVNNERLEFLGDAILDAIVGDIVYRHFPGKREGFLTNTRSKLVQRETLGRLAQEMGIHRLVLSNGRSSSHNSYMGGNAFEALVGALYLDHGYKACMQFMERRILKQMINIDKVAYKEVNFKSKLLEWSQKNRVKMVFDQVSTKKDKDANQVFVFRVLIEGVAGAEGEGYSKKESQQKAAKATLEKLKKEPQYIDAVFAAKASRTKMEEEPVAVVPSTDESQAFMTTQPTEVPEEEKTVTAFREEVYRDEPQQEAAEERRNVRRSPMYASHDDAAGHEPADDKAAADDFDLSDITATPAELSREDIIAAAEAAAFEAETKA